MVVLAEGKSTPNYTRRSLSPAVMGSSALEVTRYCNPIFFFQITSKVRDYDVIRLLLLSRKQAALLNRNFVCESVS